MPFTWLDSLVSCLYLIREEFSDQTQKWQESMTSTLQKRAPAWDLIGANVARPPPRLYSMRMSNAGSWGLSSGTYLALKLSRQNDLGIIGRPLQVIQLYQSWILNLESWMLHVIRLYRSPQSDHDLHPKFDPSYWPVADALSLSHTSLPSIDRHILILLLSYCFFLQLAWLLFVSGILVERCPVGEKGALVVEASVIEALIDDNMTHQGTHTERITLTLISRHHIW